MLIVDGTNKKKKSSQVKRHSTDSHGVVLNKDASPVEQNTPKTRTLATKLQLTSETNMKTGQRKANT